MSTISGEASDDHLELFNLVWLDDNPQEDRGTLLELRKAINHLKTFQDREECQRYIEERSGNDRIVLIVNGRLGHSLLTSIHDRPQISSIYIYCMNKTKNEQWTTGFSKIKKVVTKLSELVSHIHDDFKVNKEISEPLAIGYSTTELTGEFVLFQCLIYCLLHIAPDENDKIELIKRCIDEYKDNRSEMVHIDEFQNDDTSKNAIWWYTRESFVYKTLNAALRKRNIHMMFLYRSFVFDLWKQLATHQSKEKLELYRTQLMSREEIDILERNINQLISINAFFSSSRNRQSALFLLGDTETSITEERVLFEIEADPSKVNSKPFADISGLSNFTEEAEVLFMLGSIFRVKHVYPPANERVWIIRLELCSDDEHDLSDVLTKMKSELVYGETNLHILGKVLASMGEFKLAKFYYERFLDKLSAEDLRCRTLYEDLAILTSQNRLYDESMLWRRKIMKFDHQFALATYNKLVEIPLVAKWAKEGITIAGGCRAGEELDQLSQPEGLAVDDDGTVFIADSNNHRVVAWNQNNSITGRIVAGGNGKGDRMDQLNYPTDVAIDKESDCLIICDRHNRRVMRWSRKTGTNVGDIIIDDIDCCGLAIDDHGNIYVTESIKQEVRRYPKGEKVGIVVAGGNGTGHGLHQLDSPNLVCVDKEGAIYVSDFDNHRVVKWTKGASRGTVVAGGEEGESRKNLSGPQGIVVDASNNLYVADLGNHRVMKWPSGSKRGEIIAGGFGEGEAASQFRGPFGLAFNGRGDLYVSDWENHRVQYFPIDNTTVGNL